MLKIKPLFPLLCSLLFSSQGALAAACCGGGFAAPALIVGDDKALLTAAYTYSRVTDDVGADSLWRKRQSREASETLKIEGAHIFHDRWQAGASIPVVRKSRAGESSSGLGDLVGTLGYEYLTDWDYHPWRPRALGFLQVIVPTGRSIHEAAEIYQLDSRGRGFWAVGGGTVLTKILGRWDLHSSLDVHRSFDKSDEGANASGVLKPGFGGNFGFGAGYSAGEFRIGGGLAWTAEDAVDVTGATASKGSPQRYATASASVSYLFPQQYTATITYADQTLIGDPMNTTLGKSVTVIFQKRWFR